MRVEGQPRCCVEVKRLYLKNLIIWDDCPKCASECNFDGNFDYVSYPTIGIGTTKVSFHCIDCGEFWDKQINLELKITPAEEIDRQSDSE